MNLLTARKGVTPEEWMRIARLSGTTPAYLNQIALGFRRPSVSLASRIAEAVLTVSPGAEITKESLVFAPLKKQAPSTPNAG